MLIKEFYIEPVLITGPEKKETKKETISYQERKMKYILTDFFFLLLFSYYYEKITQISSNLLVY